MPSKGVAVYSYISVSGWSAIFRTPKTLKEHKDLNKFNIDVLEVESKNVSGRSNFTGTFSFSVRNGSLEILERWVGINSLTGAVSGGTMTTMSEQQSVTISDVIVSFGLYDAGSGSFGLPNKSQCWITITPIRSRWMKELAPPGSAQARRPFSALVLPAAHDPGMNRMDICISATTNRRKRSTLASMLIPVPDLGGVTVGSGRMFKSTFEHIARSLAITQKDSITTMLNMGARYFEFRPAHLSSKLVSNTLPDLLYFTHWLIPGMTFDDFLSEVVKFLDSNETEVVVVQVRFDGIDKSCNQATKEEIDAVVTKALSQAESRIVRGGFKDIKHPSQTIDGIREAEKRLIFLDTNAAQFNTYSDTPYATLDGNDITNTFPEQLKRFKKAELGSNQVVLWQCQATATNKKEVSFWSASHARALSSPLLCTKASCDSVVLPWLCQNLRPPAMPTRLLQVVMNDFFDGATAETAIGLSREYLNAS